MRSAAAQLGTALANLVVRMECARGGLRRQHARIGGVEFSYLEGGHGEPLVLVHGIGADKTHFVRAARHLTPHYRVIIPDLPGFGDSERLPLSAGYDIPTQMERLRQFIHHVAPGTNHLGGSSMGGWIALEYAATYPGEVASLWLLAPAGVGGARPSDMLMSYERTGEPGLFARHPEDFDGILDLVFHRRPYVPRLVRSALAQRAAADHALHLAVFETLLAGPYIEDRVANVEVPARIVWGAQDRVLDVSGAIILSNLLLGSEVRIVDGVGHLPMVERPRAIARDYVDFRMRL